MTHQSDLETLFGIAAEQMKTNLCPTQLMGLTAVALHPGITKYGVRMKLGSEFPYQTLKTLVERVLIEEVPADPEFVPCKGRKQRWGMAITEEGRDMLRAILKEGARRGRGEG
jgi:hypothetical protein